MAYRIVNPGDSVSVLGSAARTATPTIDEFELAGTSSGLVVVIDMTAVTATGSVTFTVKGYDVVSTKTWDILVSAAITATGTTVLRVSPHLTAAANTIAKDIVPAVFTVTAVHVNGVSMTYSVGAQVV